MLMHAIAHGGVQTHVREFALKVDSGRKIPCRTGESNLPQRRAGPMLYRLSYIPTSTITLLLLPFKMRASGTLSREVHVCSTVPHRLTCDSACCRGL